jgi:flagellar hook-associated protein 2
MAGTITMAGLASGMDVSGMIDALVQANGVRMAAMKSRMQATQASSTNISGVATLLAKLKSAVDALSDTSNIQGYAASSSDTALQLSVTGAANGGRYSVDVKTLAQEYRAYSSPVASSSSALGQTGTMAIQVGSASPEGITINADDSLDAIVDKINEAGIGVQASTFNDGSQVRLQLRGLNSGAGYEVVVTGLDLGLNLAENVKQQARSAHLVIDGFDVYSQTNQIVGAIPGVTITATAQTTSAATIEVKTDPTSVKSKIQAVVTAYNAVVGKVQSLAGYGTTKASDDLLAGDSTLRDLTSRMSDTIMSVAGNDAKYQTLSSLGVSLNRDGTLAFDDTKLTKALSTSPTAVTKILAGTSSSDGVMDVMSHLVDTFTRSGDGLLVNKRTTLDAAAKRLLTQADSEQSRLDDYRAKLERQFQAMDDAMTAANSTSAYLTALAGVATKTSTSK